MSVAEVTEAFQKSGVDLVTHLKLGSTRVLVPRDEDGRREPSLQILVFDSVKAAKRQESMEIGLQKSGTATGDFFIARKENVCGAPGWQHVRPRRRPGRPRAPVAAPPIPMLGMPRTRRGATFPRCTRSAGIRTSLSWQPHRLTLLALRVCAPALPSVQARHHKRKESPACATA